MLKDMKRTGGFTLVEILITITVMGILLTLAFVNLSGSQTRARDEDRRTDATVIAQTLDSLYRSGKDNPPVPLTAVAPGTYPTAAQMNDEDFRDWYFQDIDTAGRTVAGTTPSTDSIVAPGVGGAIAFGTGSETDISQYAYIPLALSAGSLVLCEDAPDECRQFIIRYKLESDPGTAVEIRSKYQ